MFLPGVLLSSLLYAIESLCKRQQNRFYNLSQTKAHKKAEYCYSTPLKKENLEIHRQTKG